MSHTYGQRIILYIYIMEDILDLIQDLHWHNTWIEDFFKEVKSGDYSFVLEYKHRKLYSIL